MTVSICHCYTDINSHVKCQGLTLKTTFRVLYYSPEKLRKYFRHCQSLANYAAVLTGRNMDLTRLSVCLSCTGS